MGYIALQTAIDAVVAALNDFDPELGRRAAEILTDDLRANIHEEPFPKTHMMCCRPAGITVEDLKKMDMYRSEQDHIELYGERFALQTNDEDYAIVDLEYVGTTESVIILAHEVGHAIADDIQRHREISFRSFITDDLKNPTPQLEKQAYFVQSIVEHHLDKHGSDYGIDYTIPKQDKIQQDWNVAQQPDEETPSNRAVQYKAANSTFQRTLAVTDPTERSSLVVAALTENTGDDGHFMQDIVASRKFNAARPDSHNKL